MKKMSTKRALSMVLAIAMMISMLPAIALTGSAATVAPIVIDFTKANINGGTSGAVAVSTISSTEFTSVAEESSTYTGDTQRFYTSTSSGVKYLMASMSHGSWDSRSTPWTKNEKARWTIEIPVETAGWYTMDFITGTWSAGGEFYVYADGNYAGELNCYTEQTGDFFYAEDKLENAVYLTPDENGKVKIMFALKRQVYNSPGRVLLNKMTLTYVGANLTYSASSTIPSMIELGDTIDVEAFAKLPGGNAYVSNGYNADRTTNNDKTTVAVKSGTSATIAETETVDGVYKGKVTAAELGETTFTITSVVGGTTYTKDVTVEVVNAFTPKKIELEFTRTTMDEPYSIAPPGWTLTDKANFEIAWDETTTGTGSRFYNTTEFEGGKILWLATRAYSNLTWIKAAASTNATAKMTDAMFTVETELLVPGWYNFSMLGALNKSASEYYVYVNDEYAGLYSFFKDGEGGFPQGEVKSMNSLYLEPDSNGKVRISLCVAATHYSTAYAAPYKMWLTPVEAEKVEFKEFTHNIPESVYLGDVINAEFRAEMSDGSYRHLNGYLGDATVDAKNSMSVAVKSGTSLGFASTYDALTSDGVYTATLTANAEGENVITATVVIDGETYTQDIPVTVKPVPKLSDVGVSTNYKQILIGKNAKVNYTLLRDDGKPYPDDGEKTVTYESLNTDVATASADGTVTGVTAGDATIKVTVVTPNATVSGETKITIIESVSEKELEFSENTMPTGGSSTPLNTWTVKENANFAFVPELTSSGTGSRVQYNVPEFGASLDLFCFGPRAYSNLTWIKAAARTDANEVDAMVTIETEIDAPGWYNIRMLGGGWQSASEFYVYVNGKYAGLYNFYVEGAASFVSTGEKKLNTLYLEPDSNGKVRISFCVAKTHYSTPYGIIYKMWITPAEEVTFKDFAHNVPETIYVDESADIEIKAEMSDGTYRHINGYDFEAKADNNNSFAVTVKSGSSVEVESSYDPLVSDGVYEGKLTAKSIGETVITATVVIDGVTYTKDITVKVENPPMLKTVDVAFDKDTILATRTANASLTLIREDGSAYPEDKPQTITFESSDKTVATVDKNGVITGVSAGTATIKATVITPDATISGEKEITVTDAPTLSEIHIKANNNSLIIGGTKKLSVEAIMSDELPGDISKYTVSYESNNEEIATVSEDGVVTAHKEGNVIISAKAKNEGGSTLSAVIRLDVFAGIPPVIVDFTQTVCERHAVPTDTPGYTLVYPGSSDMSKYTYSNGRSLLHVATRAPSNAVWPASKDMKNAFGIKVNIPFESDYSITLIGGSSSGGAMYSIFVDGVYVGDHSFYDAEYDSMHYDELNTLNTIHLTEGEHEVIMRARKSIYSTAYAQLDTLSFIPVDGDTVFDSIVADIPTELAVGEVYTCEAYAKMTDGSAYHFGVTAEGEIDKENTFSAEKEGDSLTLSDFTSYEIGKSGKSKLTLTGVSEGKTKITLAATVGGKTVTKEVEVNVTNDPIKSVDAEIEAEELFVGDKSLLISKALLTSGRELKSAEISYESLTPDIATVEENVLTALAIGIAKIKVTASFNGDTVESTIDVEILPEGMTDIRVTAGGSEHIRWTDAADANVDDYLVPLYVQAISNLGNEIDMSEAAITARALTPEVAYLDDVMNIVPVYADPDNGSEAVFEVTVKTPDGRIRTVTKTLIVANAKTKATYMTAEKAEAARANVAKYDWAKSAADSSYIKLADAFVDRVDELYDMITSNEVPRSTGIGAEGDPEMYYCRYCATDIRLNYGSYSWQHNPLTRPWKVQCPDCKRYFPSNDFGSFYKLGLNEYGEFSRQRALDAHAELFGDKNAEVGSDAYYGYGKGYLRNDLYRDVVTATTINVNKGLRPGESVDTWGVDDGMGYVPKKPDGTPYTYDNGVIERHVYIGEYMHSGVWRKQVAGGGVVIEAITRCSNAYFYTGDKKYGRVAAILLDRVADFYPDYDISVFGDNVWNSDGGSNRGKTIGRIWETGTLGTFMSAYDMVFDMYDDPQVMNFLREKASTYKMRHAKDTPNQIRTNIEDGIIREGLDCLVTTEVAGNFGYPQIPNARGAVILDSMPETKYWLDYLMAPGWTTVEPCLGGGIGETLINTIDADGQGNEASTYNVAWHTTLIRINDILEGYDKYASANFFNNPKFVTMFYSNLPLIASYYSPNIGDSGSTLSKTHWIGNEVALSGWKNLRDPIFAQVLYMLNGNSSKGLHYGDTDPDPESLAREVQQVIDQYGVLNLDSEMMTNFGFGILRDGGDYTNVTDATAQETRRNVWMYFGSNGGHGHGDTLNLGMTAFGLNFMPELAYPEATGTQPNRLQWVQTTLSHNTVMVDEVQQTSETEIRGNQLHFDDAGMVQVMDVDANYVYKAADQYRRSVVYIKVDDENSYAVDFFRVKGGNDHLYSFHASSNEINGTEGLDLVPQAVDGEYVGSYAGADVPYGPDPNSPEAWSYVTVYPRGYTWLKNVDRAKNPESKFEIDFAIKDFNRAIKDSKGLALHMTMLNDGNIKDGVTREVSIADGLPPQKVENKNIDKFKYVLVKHTGENLDTTFTTVFEPYRNERYIADTSELAMEITDGAENAGDAHRAVKVTFENGRCDYIFYSTNNDVTYSVTDGDKTLAFRGFVGVYTLQNGENTYKYVHDGDIIGEVTNAKTELNAVVKSFTKEHSLENEIVITPVEQLSDEGILDLANRYIFVDNDPKMRSGAFRIYGATRDGDDIILDIGRVTPIRQYVNAYDESKGYIYTIEEGQTARIPLSYSEKNEPVFAPVADGISASAGSSISMTVSAESPLGRDISYKAESLPRGASLNAETGAITWKPTDSQVGDNHFAITAFDTDGRESTLHFVVTVYGSTTGNTQTPEKPDEPTTTPGGSGEGTGSTGGSGGSGGSGGGTTTPSVPEKPEVPETGNEGETSTARFTDLHNHAWAEDAINSLADKGIIKGTSETTFSPANNITRADFAILLVRAFEKTSDNAENFSDVSENDYFAKELAIARNTGLVSGIGDNKFAPRSYIKRCDMMLMVYRVLKDTEAFVGRAAPGTPDYPDFDTVPEYAKEAVSTLIGAGLVNGKGDKIAPNDNTTRAEVAVLLQRVLDYVKK